MSKEEITVTVTATEPRVHITRYMVGICHMQVCAVADATDEEILRVCNERNPAGTEAGWTTVFREDAEGLGRAPVTCKLIPERRHFLVAC